MRSNHAARRWLLPLAFSAAAWIGTPARVEAAAPLTLDDVLASVERTHPKLESAEQKVIKAEAKSLGARGGWDPVLGIKGKWSPIGYYDNGQVDTTVRQATPAWGAALYAGYRIGWGEYPVYKGELETLSAGEIRAGIDVPVWRNGPIDERRAKIQKTRLREEGAREARTAAQLELERDAANAYWRWVAAGQNLEVARELLAIAERRDAGLNEQAKAGAIEQIKLVDNRRLVLDRMGKVVSAEQKFQQSALKLSLFLRDENLNPIRPGEELVPDRFPEPEVIDAADVARDVERAVEQRPDLRALRAEREASSVDVDLTRNQRAPKLNLQTFVAKDFGDGPEELEPAEWGIGLSFELPIPLRKARGEFQAAQADLAGVDAELRGMTDKVAAEVREAHVSVEASRQNVLLARQQVEAAKRLAEAERIRLDEGATDLVILNLREIAAAEAADRKSVV
jgi:outer membrane protein, heavy metal efflux system